MLNPFMSAIAKINRNYKIKPAVTSLGIEKGKEKIPSKLREKL